MNKVITLKLEGSLEIGFSANLTVAEEGKSPFIDVAGHLPANLELWQTYTDWQKSYDSLEGSNRIIRVNNKPTNVSLKKLKETCDRATITLKKTFNNWLLSDEFRHLRDQCISQFSFPHQEIRFLICSSDKILQKLPWNQWSLVENNDRIEIALSSTKSENVPCYTNKNNQIKILAILGDSSGIDLEKDKAFLENLKNTKIEFLSEPKQTDINEKLWDQGWDILFFAGHSKTQEAKGKLYLNSTDSISIEDLKYGLKRSIERGLQLAIFNSCDGLGLAWELQELQIPQVIILRESVPDLVAQTFLKYFLTAYSNGNSLYLSVKEARNKLHGDGLDHQYPCASWLPTIIQNSVTIPPTWHSLRYGNTTEINQRVFRTSLIASVGITALILVTRSFGLLQGWELTMFDRFMGLKPNEGQDNRLLVVEITEKDIQYQKERGMKDQWSLSDTALLRLLDKLQSYQPRAIGLDIYRDYPTNNNALKRQFSQQDNFFAICKGGNLIDGTLGVAPPPEVPSYRIASVDVTKDRDEVLRRYSWKANFDNPSHCTAVNSLGFLLSMYYLDREGATITPNAENGSIQINNTHLVPLEFPANGYQGKGEEDKGHQILLNYRNLWKIAPSVTLSEVLAGKIDPNLIKDRIILIGVTVVEGSRDEFMTPLSHNASEKMYGVYIHAQMISQVISAVLDGRPLLSVWPSWVEGLWILGWSIGGGLIAWRFQKVWYILLADGVMIILLTGTAFGLFLLGWWIPVVPSLLGLLGTSGVVGMSRCAYLGKLA